jgi:hypothetical protein
MLWRWWSFGLTASEEGLTVAGYYLKHADALCAGRLYVMPYAAQHPALQPPIGKRLIAVVVFITAPMQPVKQLI